MLLLGAIALAGCGGEDRASQAPPPKPQLFGPGPRFRPKPYGEAVKRARPIHGLRCERRTRKRHLAFVETIIDGRVVRMPAGIGIAPPQRHHGAYVESGRCDYPLRTREPTGKVEVERGRAVTVGDLFEVWGQPLSRRRVLSFHGPVRAYAGRQRAEGDPRRLRLREHAVITLETGRYVPPHASYAFPRG